MMNSCRSAAGLVGLSVVTLVIVDACASGAQQSIGELMVDAGMALAGRSGAGAAGMEAATSDPGEPAGILVEAGQLFVDAGSALLDAGSDFKPDAAAQQSTGKSGSRIQLQRMTQTGSDGTVYESPLVGYFDTKLDAACSLSTMSDGSMRCIPAATGLSTLYFSDAGCSARLAVVVDACSTPTFFSETIVPGAPSCSPPYYTRIFRAGAEYAGTAYQGISTNCVAAAPLAGYRLFSVGAEMPPSEFIAFTGTTVSL